MWQSDENENHQCTSTETTAPPGRQQNSRAVPPGSIWQFPLLFFYGFVERSREKISHRCVLLWRPAARLPCPLDLASIACFHFHGCPQLEGTGKLRDRVTSNGDDGEACRDWTATAETVGQKPSLRPSKRPATNRPASTTPLLIRVDQLQGPRP